MAAATPISASSTIVNVAEDAELRLIRILSPGAAFESKCESCIARADAQALIGTIISSEGAMDNLFKKMEEMEETISAFSLLAALLERVEDPKDEAVLAKHMAEVISDKSKGYDPTKRIGMLCALFNLRTDGQEKCDLIKRIVGICGEDPAVGEEFIGGAGSLGATLLDPNNLLTMCEAWEVSKEEIRELYRVCGQVLGDVIKGKEGQVKKQTFLLLEVATYKDEASIDDKARLVAQSVAINTIRDPVTLFNEQRAILNLPAISALANSTNTKPLHKLLTIFQEGKLTDFQSFLSQNTSTLKSFNLSEEECTYNIRLLSLVSLAAEYEEMIPYQAIAATLKVPETDVESWVIAAVQKDLLEAKMDQLEKVVMVERCVVRKFGMEQWKIMKERLDLWKKNVKGVLDGLKEQKQNPSQ